MKKLVNKPLRLLAISASAVLITACTSNGPTDQSTGSVSGGISGYATAAYMKVSNAVTILVNSGKEALGMPVVVAQPSQKVIKANGGLVYRVGDLVTIVIPSSMIYEPGKPYMLPSADTYLQAAAGIIKAFPNSNVLVTASEAGLFSKSDDLQLSNLQAQHFAVGLSHYGVNSNLGQRNLYFTGLGDRKMVADSNYASGMNANRRIQITIYPSGKPLKHQIKDFKIDAY